MKVSDIKIGDTRLGSWDDAMNAHPLCPILWKFNFITIPTMLILEIWCW